MSALSSAALCFVWLLNRIRHTSFLATQLLCCPFRCARSTYQCIQSSLCMLASAKFKRNRANTNEYSFGLCCGAGASVALVMPLKNCWCMRVCSSYRTIARLIHTAYNNNRRRNKKCMRDFHERGGGERGDGFYVRVYVYGAKADAEFCEVLQWD